MNNHSDIIYLFLGDANIAMQIHMCNYCVLSPTLLRGTINDIKYTPWCGSLNIIYTPLSGLTHFITAVNIEHAHQRISVEISDSVTISTPDIPNDFKHMNVHDIILIASPDIEPACVDVSWRIWGDGQSTLRMTASSTTSGPSVDYIERRRKNLQPRSALDQYIEIITE